MSTQDAKTSIGTGSEAGDRVFLRKASGLIKTAGTTDVFIYNIGLVSIGIGIGSMILYGPSVYPGANMFVGVLLAVFMMGLIAWGMLCWTVTIPRSGGVYPFGSRILPPGVAMMLSFVESVAWLFFCALAAYWVVTIGIIPMFTVSAAVTGNSSLTSVATFFSHKGITFLTGTIVLLLAGGILTSGMRRYFFSQKIVFVISFLGTLLLIGLLLFGSRATFIHNFNHYFGPKVTYASVIASGKAGGWSNTGFSLGTTLKASNWAFLPLIGAAFSIAIGGEIKSGMKGQARGMFGALTISGVTFLIVIALAYHIFGYDFLGTVAYNSLGFNTGNAVLTTPTTPWITLLAGVLSGSWIVTVLVSVSFMTWIWMWIPGCRPMASGR